MEQIKLRAYDGIAVTGFLTLSWLFYTLPGAVMEQSGSAAWMSVILAHVFILAVFAITRFAHRNRIL